MSNTLTKEILTALNKEVINQLDLVNSITHPAENGKARERIIANFFSKLLPRSYSISSGFVIDAVGGISKQIDLVIYRNDYHPIFQVGEVNYFPAECVALVIEVKSTIKDKKTLQVALENIKSVKTLDRTNRGKNYLVAGQSRGSTVDPTDFKHQIFGAILTEKTMKRETLIQALRVFLKDNPRSIWPNFYADVRNLSVAYLETGDTQKIHAVPGAATHLALTDASDINSVPPLIELSFEILNFLRVIPVIDYKPTDYLFDSSGQTTWWNI